MGIMTGTQGMVQNTPPPLTRGPSLFPSQWRAAWGPVEVPTSPTQAPVIRPLTPEAASGGKMVPMNTLGTFKVGTPNVMPLAVVPNAPLLTKVQCRNRYWRPRLWASKMAPGYAQKTRRFSDHPLPVPSMQAWSSNPVAQRPARIGGRRVTNWPNPQSNWPTFGPGGT